MGKRQDFATRIIHDKKIYLLAEDCAKALDYSSIKKFVEENEDIIKEIDGIKGLICEEDYNRLLVKREDAFQKQLHLEITKSETLEAEMKMKTGSYGFKMLLGRKIYERKAAEKGCSSIEEYIEKYDFQEEAQKALKELKEKKIMDSQYSEDVGYLLSDKFFISDVLKKNKLEIQVLTHISESGEIQLEAFLAGEGIFYQVGFYEVWEWYFDSNNVAVDSEEKSVRTVNFLNCMDYSGLHLDEQGELYIPHYDENTGTIVDKKIGKSEDIRDCREFSVFDNILWAATNSKPEQNGIGFVIYEAPGVSLHLEDVIILDILSGNLVGERIYLDGIADCHKKSAQTKTGNLKVFAWE